MNLAQVGSVLDIPVTSYEARPGAWVLFRAGKQYSQWGHSSVVLRNGTSTITIVEANLLPGQITVREISKKDPLIKGYYIEPYNLSSLLQ